MSKNKAPNVLTEKPVRLKGTLIRLAVFGLLGVAFTLLNENGIYLFQFVPAEGGAEALKTTTLMFYLAFVCYCVAGYSLAALITIAKVTSKNGTAGEVSMLAKLFRICAVIAALIGVALVFDKVSAFTSAVSAFAGMMLGWSLQAPVSGIAAWIMVTITRPYKIGDRIQLPSYGLMGDIVKFSPLYLSLNQVGGTVGGEEASGRILHVPNAVLFSALIVNTTYQQKAETQAYILDEVVFRVTLDSDWDTVESIILNAARTATADIIQATGKEPYVRAETWDYGTIFRVRYMTDATDRPKFMHQIVKTATKEFQVNKNVDLTIPYLYSFKRGSTAVSARNTDNDTSKQENINIDDIISKDIPLEQIALECHEEITILAKSIMNKGLLQPIVVTRDMEIPDKYNIVFGEKRLIACRQLGWKKVPCTVKNPLGTELSKPPSPGDDADCRSECPNS